MIILVKCRDGIYSLALHSQLEQLVEEGLISAFFEEGTWKSVGKPLSNSNMSVARRSPPRIAALVSSF